MKVKTLVNVEMIRSDDVYALLSKINGVKDYLQKGYDLMGRLQFVNNQYIQYVAKYECKEVNLHHDVTTLIEGNKVTVKNEKGWCLSLEIKNKSCIKETLRMSSELLRFGYTYLPKEWLREVK
jgi:hypothetical protein